ncbi:MAG: FKBP-type peptidyl-prolyl cis-trans isomerase [Ginsengibacter sp.]
MKNIVFPILLLTIIFTGCLKNDKCSYNDSSLVAPPTEISNLKDSLTAHGITATLHPSGFYYNIVNPGSGASVSNLCTNITVDYKGSLFNGTVFDSSVVNNPANFQLGTVIVGWQKAIPLLKVGGEIDLYIPPSLAYGNRTQQAGSVVIPAGSNLVFHVHVIDIQ